MRLCFIMDTEFSGEKSKKSNVRSSQIFYNIADEDMSEFFLDTVEEEGEREKEER